MSSECKTEPAETIPTKPLTHIRFGTVSDEISTKLKQLQNNITDHIASQKNYGFKFSHKSLKIISGDLLSKNEISPTPEVGTWDRPNRVFFNGHLESETCLGLYALNMGIKYVVSDIHDFPEGTQFRHTRLDCCYKSYIFATALFDTVHVSLIGHRHSKNLYTTDSIAPHVALYKFYTQEDDFFFQYTLDLDTFTTDASQVPLMLAKNVKKVAKFIYLTLEKSKGHTKANEWLDTLLENDAEIQAFYRKCMSTIFTPLEIAVPKKMSMSKMDRVLQIITPKIDTIFYPDHIETLQEFNTTLSRLNTIPAYKAALEFTDTWINDLKTAITKESWRELEKTLLATPSFDAKFYMPGEDKATTKPINIIFNPADVYYFVEDLNAWLTPFMHAVSLGDIDKMILLKTYNMANLTHTAFYPFQISRVLPSRAGKTALFFTKTPEIANILLDWGANPFHMHQNHQAEESFSLYAKKQFTKPELQALNPLLTILPLAYDINALIDIHQHPRDKALKLIKLIECILEHPADSSFYFTRSNWFVLFRTTPNTGGSEHPHILEVSKVYQRFFKGVKPGEQHRNNFAINLEDAEILKLANMLIENIVIDHINAIRFKNGRSLLNGSSKYKSNRKLISPYTFTEFTFYCAYDNSTDTITLSPYPKSEEIKKILRESLSCWVPYHEGTLNCQDLIDVYHKTLVPYEGIVRSFGPFFPVAERIEYGLATEGGHNCRPMDPYQFMDRPPLFGEEFKLKRGSTIPKQQYYNVYRTDRNRIIHLSHMPDFPEFIPDSDEFIPGSLKYISLKDIQQSKIELRTHYVNRKKTTFLHELFKAFTTRFQTKFERPISIDISGEFTEDRFIPSNSFGTILDPEDDLNDEDPFIVDIFVNEGQSGICDYLSEQLSFIFGKHASGNPIVKVTDVDFPYVRLDETLDKAMQALSSGTYDPNYKSITGFVYMIHQTHYKLCQEKYLLTTVTHRTNMLMLEASYGNKKFLYTETGIYQPIILNPKLSRQFELATRLFTLLNMRVLPHPFINGIVYRKATYLPHRITTSNELEELGLAFTGANSFNKAEYRSSLLFCPPVSMHSETPLTGLASGLIDKTQEYFTKILLGPSNIHPYMEDGKKSEYVKTLSTIMQTPESFKGFLNKNIDEIWVDYPQEIEKIKAWIEDQFNCFFRQRPCGLAQARVICEDGEVYLEAITLFKSIPGLQDHLSDTSSDASSTLTEEMKNE